MNPHRKIRGSGYKHTLPAVGPLFAAWVLLVVLSAPALTVAMMLGGIVPESSHDDIWFFLLTRLPVLVLAAVALAVYTTTRVAGPLVQLTWAFDDVKEGDMDRRLRLRRGDKHLRKLETSFNDMMVALNERGVRPLDGDDPTASGSHQAGP